MHNALTLKKVAKEQFVIKNYAALEQIILERYVLDHSQFMCEIILLASADLKAFYDIIIHTATALALLQIWIYHAKINSMFSTI